MRTGELVRDPGELRIADVNSSCCTCTWELEVTELVVVVGMVEVSDEEIMFRVDEINWRVLWSSKAVKLVRMPPAPRQALLWPGKTT